MKAIDFLKQLQKNPEYSAKQLLEQQQKRNKQAEIKNIEASFIADLHSHGFAEIEAVSDLIKLRKVSAKLVGLLLAWIPKLDDRYHSKEMAVRALAVASESFDGTLLINLFDNRESSFGLRWAVGNTLASASVENVDQWIEEKLNESSVGKECEMLVYAAIKYFDQYKARQLLRNLFDFFPLQVADAFTYFGNQGDLNFLERRIKNYKGESKQEIAAAILKLKSKI